MRVLNKKIWPYKVRIKEKTDDECKEVYSWIDENLCMRRKDMYAVNSTFYFKHEQDLLLFTLRWA
jgi:hypothetical protein